MKASAPSSRSGSRNGRNRAGHYIGTDIDMKDAVFLGDSRAVLRSFPYEVRREAGFQIDLVQNGKDPKDWKPLKTVGRGVREIRIRDESGAYRIVYIATMADAVYVLHAFQKKTEATARRDLELAKKRLEM